MFLCWRVAPCRISVGHFCDAANKKTTALVLFASICPPLNKTPENTRHPACIVTEQTGLLADKKYHLGYNTHIISLELSIVFLLPCVCSDSIRGVTIGNKRPAAGRIRCNRLAVYAGTHNSTRTKQGNFSARDRDSR